MPSASAVQVANSIVLASDHDRASRRSLVVREPPTVARRIIPPPPPLTDIVVRTKIPQLDQQRDTGARYQANFTGSRASADLLPALPPLPPGYEAYAPQIFGTPMVTYHVCRICMRPRSERYHREHPIAPHSVPPPPGICRRCRVTGVEDRLDNAEVIKIEESGPVRLGLECLIPEDDLYTRRQLRDEIDLGRVHDHVRVVRRARSSSRPREEARDVKVVYRYVMPQGGLPAKDGPKLAEVSVENLAALDDLNNAKAVKKVSSPKPSVSLEKVPTEKADDKPKPRRDYSESEIRRLARDEVVRYRQAERMIEAHPEPYAHGRLLPVQRQLEKSNQQAPQLDAASIAPSIEAAPVKPPKQKEPARPAAGRVESARKSQRREGIVIDREIRYHYDDTGKADSAGSKAVPKQESLKQVAPRSKDGRSEKAQDEMVIEIVTRDSKEGDLPSSENNRKTKNIQDKAGCVSRKTERAIREPAPSPPSDKGTYGVKSSSKPAAAVREAPVQVSQQSIPQVSVHRSHRSTRRDSLCGIEIVREVVEEPAEAAPLPRHSSTASMHQSMTRYDDESVNRASKRGIASLSKSRPMIGRNDLDVLVDVDLPQHSTTSRQANERVMTSIDKDQQQRITIEATLPRESSTSPGLSNWTDRDYWKDGYTVKTASRHSRTAPAQYSSRSVHGSSARECNPAELHDDRHADLEYAARDTKTSTARLAIDARPSTRLSHDQSWYKTRTKDIQIHRSDALPPEPVRTTPSDRASGHSYYTSTKRESDHRGYDHERRPSFEYEYCERTVQPADRPVGSRPFDDSPPLLTQESETLYTYKPMISKDPVETDTVPKKRPGLASLPEIPGNSSLSQNPTGSKSSMRSPGKGPRIREYIDQDGNKVTQVRFANKVVFSPTPPGSDDYPPSADKRKDRSDARRAERRNQIVNMNQVTEVQIPQHESHHSRGRGPNRPESMTEQEYRRTAFRPARSPEEEKVNSIPVDPSRKISRASSESPSREKALLELNGQAERRLNPDRVHGEFVDRYGPYRKETREESMVAACGSSSTPAPGTMREI